MGNLVIRTMDFLFFGSLQNCNLRITKTML